MSRKILVSLFLEHTTEQQETPHLPMISAKMEVLVIQFNALVKIMRTKKFKALRDLNYPAWVERLTIYREQQDGLLFQIDSLGNTAGGTVHIWDGAV